VLVVDDDQPTRELLRRAIEQEGRPVAEAENGRAALTWLEDHEPDLVLLDLIMPEMDGFEFLEAVRARDEWRAIPVVVVTAKQLTDDDRWRLNGGVERVLAKPGNSSEPLLDQIRELVGGGERP
jgi:CheY-like chemotaxis protein